MNDQRQNGNWFMDAARERSMPGGGKQLIQAWKQEGKINMTKNDGTEQAQAHVKLGITHNLGNFESLRIDIGCTIPVGDVEKGIDDAYSFTEGKLEQKFNELKRLF